MAKERERKLPNKGGDSKVIGTGKHRSGQTGQYIKKSQVGKRQTKQSNKKK